jgi:methyl-accepting chemotaxis protein
MAAENRYFAQLNRAGDRLLIGVLAGLMVLSLCLVPLHGTLAPSLLIGLPALGVCAWLTAAHGGSLVTRCAIGAALMIFSGLLIHQTHGMIEMHFSVFVLLAFLLYYRDWVPLVVAAGVIAAHHLGFDLMQRMGQPVWVFAENTGFYIVLIHAAYVVFETALLVWIAITLRREVTALGGNPNELAEVAQRLAGGKLDVQIGTEGASEASLAVAMERMRAELERNIEAERATGAELKQQAETQRELVERQRATADELSANVARERAAAEENSRIRAALDGVGAGAMVVDLEGRIVYVNEFAQAMFRTRAGDIRAASSSFDADRLIGGRIDQFHGVAWFAPQQLEKLEGNRTADLTFGNAQLRVIASPVRGEAGKRLGSVLQWQDRTQEVRAEQEVQSAVTRAVSGDLTVRLSEQGMDGFFRALAVGMNALLGGLSSTMQQVRGAAGEVNRGADEISQGNLNLSQRTEEQASSLQRTAASMVQMTTTVKQNADNANQANQLAAAARNQAEQGGAVVANAVKAMSEINSSSTRIADIIGVIDEIAFQTNLLALNAAVEAARAGELGRGFAVVASEVRSLAGRSATAAKEIKTLIQDNVHKVDEGSTLVSRSGTTLEQIVASVKKVSDIVAEIAAASGEQSADINQVNKAVMQLEELTQQNAALVEESSAASQSMAEQARSLNESMARFTLDAGFKGSGARVAPLRRAS